MRQHITASISKEAFDWLTEQSRRDNFAKFSNTLDKTVLAQKNTAPLARREYLKEQLHMTVRELTNHVNRFSLAQLDALVKESAHLSAWEGEEK